MITPRRTYLHRVPTLRAFRDVLLALIPVRDLRLARETAVIVPTRSAAALLRRAIEERHLQAPDAAVVFCDIVSRRDWYGELHRRAGVARPMLTPYERDVLIQAAAHEAVTQGAVPPFHLRPALVGEIRRLYDTIRRRRQTVDDFERLVVPGLEATADGDRGAERLLRQTRFLITTFRGYEQRVQRSGGWDEHGLRSWLLAHGLSRPYRQVIVSVADRTWDPDGLWDADFDLLTRQPGLVRVDVVATERQLALGLLERFHDLLPDVEDVSQDEANLADAGPVLLVPATDRPYYESRDREEELADRARLIKALAKRDPDPVRLDRVALVFYRPLPYLYLARGLFEDARIPVEARDALPLAAEPFAAALDLVFSLVSTGFSRSAIVQLLSAPQFDFVVDGRTVNTDDVGALDAALGDRDHLGEVERLERLVVDWEGDEAPPPWDRRLDARAAARAGAAAVAAARQLAPLFEQARATEQLDALVRFLAEHVRPVPRDWLFDRETRARGAVQAILDGLKAAHGRYDDPLWNPDELATTVRRWIENETFTPASDGTGVQLLDAAAARFADLDDAHLVGLVEGEWPARPRRNIFYSPTLLASLGWPVEIGHTESARAAFLDLLESAARRTSVSTFSLEDDVLVEPSSLLVDMDRVSPSALSFETPRTLVFADEALMIRPVVPGVSEAERDAWVRLRGGRPPATAAEFHGAANPQDPRPRSVTSVELYVQCPFKYFARHVLRLEEERNEEEGLTPLERGRFLHEAFEALFTAWEARGGRTIAPDTLDAVRALAHEVLEPHLSRLAPTDAAFERARLFGSPVAPGLVDLVIRMEAERQAAVVERRVEHRLDGLYRVTGRDGPREVAIRGIADRIDLLADGTFRIIDYKSSKPVRPLQLAIYAACARQRLAGHRGRDWQVSEAAYLTFRGDPPVSSLGRGVADLEATIAEAELRFVDALDGIARGAFPPQPARKSLCASCGYAAVCRKEYVDDGDAAAAV